MAAADTTSGFVPVPGGHRIHWEESGNPRGVPAVYLHGGPGGGLGKGGYRKKFDPNQYGLIGIDQRGCGASTPSAGSPGYDLSQNTIGDLINDIEAVREHLGVDRWVLNGVSWGSTLALAYAQAHPSRVLGIVLFAVTTTSRAEVDWITEGVRNIFPEDWLAFARHAFPAQSDDDLLAGRLPRRLVAEYAALMANPNPNIRDAASRAWAKWEDVHISIGTETRLPDPRWDDDEYRRTFVTLATHYWSNDGFCDPPLLDRMPALSGIPGILLHGRRDVSGPAITAWNVHRRWPGSELFIDEADGHGGPTMINRWVDANSRLAQLVQAGN